MLGAIRRRIHLSQREDGFTMVELVIAMVIIAGVLLALIAIQISAATTVVEARKRTQATAYANEAMEQMRAMPWNILYAGLASNFKTAAGGDARVTAANVLQTPSGNFQLRVAASGAQTPATQEWIPLFDSTGSNKRVLGDAAETNTTFTIRAYVTEPTQGDATSTVGLVVTVDWIGARGKAQTTVLQTNAFKSEGCGDDSSSPFIAACQAFYDASSTSGSMTTALTAISTVVAPNSPERRTLLYPTTDTMTSMSTRTAGAAATISSHQYSTMSAFAQFGGVWRDDDDEATQPETKGWRTGFEINGVTATDNATQSDIPTNPPSTSLRQAANAENETTLSATGAIGTLLGRSDYYRPATGLATKNGVCIPNIPADQPCAVSSLGNDPTWDGGSGYTLLRLPDGTIVRLARRLADLPPPANADRAWVARFKSSGGTNAAVGCQSLTLSGCVSAGANRTMANVSIGTVVGGNWGGAAAQGLVIIEGSGSCTGVTESILVQRGSNQKATAASATRCGQVRWWSGGAYSTAGFSTGAAGPYTTAPVTYTSGTTSIQATARVTIGGWASQVTAPDTTCKAQACTITANTGSITVVVEYVITTATDSYTLVATTQIQGPSATASFKEAPDAN